MWYRVFGSNYAVLEANELLEGLNALGRPLTGHFRGDDQGWYQVELVLLPEYESLTLHRYLATEEDIRRELNAWAAGVEHLEGPESQRLMQQLISTTQLLAVQQPESGAGLEDFLVSLCQYLARETAGIYQVDGQGFFAGDGTLLVRERDE
jgi:hypothetical protein